MRLVRHGLAAAAASARPARCGRGVGRAALGLVVLVVLLAPAVASACPGCFQANDNNRVAFLVTTLVLTLLPLGMIGAGLLWLRREALRRDAPNPETT